ncbi:hypothetical protein ECLT68_4814 [Escherichia coli LT-68]|nr:hypothetical protein ECLT68_4814 [Escherichia coli LT-68]
MIFGILLKISHFFLIAFCYQKQLAFSFMTIPIAENDVSF